MTDQYIKHPHAFNAKQYALDIERRHECRLEDIIVTAKTQPLIFEMFETISHDSGASAGHHSYSVPNKYQELLESIEKSLRLYTKEERMDMAIGEHSDVQSLLSRVENGEDLNDFFNDFFDDWESTK